MFARVRKGLQLLLQQQQLQQQQLQQQQLLPLQQPQLVVQQHLQQLIRQQQQPPQAKKLNCLSKTLKQSTCLATCPMSIEINGQGFAKVAQPWPFISIDIGQVVKQVDCLSVFDKQFA